MNMPQLRIVIKMFTEEVVKELEKDGRSNLGNLGVLSTKLKHVNCLSKKYPGKRIKYTKFALRFKPRKMLKDMLNALKPIPNEKLSYRIECPKEIINRDSASVITIYVPTPIGEGVPDLKRYLTINIRE